MAKPAAVAFVTADPTKIVEKWAYTILNSFNAA